MSREGLTCFLACLLLGGCATEGEGRVTVRLSGEGPAKTGYPFEDGADVIAFVDGWSLRYTKVLVSVGAFELRSRDGARAAAATDTVVADLHLGDLAAFELRGIEARRWDRLSYVIAAPGASVRVLDGVLESDVARMRAGGYAVLVEGEATDGDETIGFSFGVPDAVLAYDCVNGVDGTAGVVVPVNGVADVEITLHLDHFFLDSIASSEPSMRFEPFAALAGGDGVVTLEDLAQTPVTEVRDRDGDYIVVDGRVLVLDPGPFVLDAERSIASYVRANALTLGHLGGEGHCDYAVLGGAP